MSEGETLYIGKMTLHDYLWYMAYRRHFNKDLIIKHTLKYYNIDLTGIIDEYMYDFKYDIYEAFRQRNPLSKEDDKSREFYNTYTRKYYIKFIQNAYFVDDEDNLTHHQKYSEIHHIYPLVYGGDNSLENLIHLSKFNHDLLHENPLEDDEIQCHGAVDYLGCLYGYNQSHKIFRKYNFDNYNDHTIHDAFKAAIKNEMMEFYNHNKIKINL